jgi:E3 ubiquitin-protein ligase CCNP1IP1
MDKVIHEANTEILSLRDKLATTQAECKSLENKNHELADSYREKARATQQVQNLYQTLKGQVLASQVATAASDDAENTLHFATANRPTDLSGPDHLRPDPHGMGRHHSMGNDYDQARAGGRSSGMRGGSGGWTAPGLGSGFLNSSKF